MSATLQTMIDFTARQTKRTEDVVKTGGIYTDDALVIVNKYIDGFNYAKNKICRERCKPIYEEDVVADSEGVIALSDLAKDAFKIIKVTDTEDGYEITNWVDDGFEIYISGGEYKTITVKYYYVPADFSNDPTALDLLVTLDLPEGIVDYRILCFYAAYEYHLIKGSDRDMDKTGFFLSKWNDGFLHVPKSIKGPRYVRGA